MISNAFREQRRLLSRSAASCRDRARPDNWSSIVKTLGFTDREVIATFARSVGPTVAWLKSFGVRFDFLPTYFITACQPRMAPIGGGLALVEALAGWCERNSGQLFYRTTARSLIQNDDGAVIGVRCVGPGHKAVSSTPPRSSSRAAGSRAIPRC